jgi:putative DNA primase/helicase
LQVGRLVDHGAAPYQHDPHNAMSYFVRIETPSGEREIWGVDLQRALKDSLTRPQVGDEIGVRALRRDAVKVLRPERDVEGRRIGEKALDAHRNAWIIEKGDFFRERAQAARVLRDPSVDRQAAVNQHPELLGTYLQLRAAELAAKTLSNPEDQRRFVASVRTALADSIARGEPLQPVSMKEMPAQRREPRPPSAPERAAAPSR